ncbi:MAG: hypothetical protein VB070_08780 [Clostridiaceae bacterium]|nr:hypothetical protein [Clostridiaceae bacterium]
MATWSDKINELLSSLEQGNMPAQMMDRINRSGVYAGRQNQPPAPGQPAVQPAAPETPPAELVNPAASVQAEPAAPAEMTAGVGTSPFLPELTPRQMMQSVIMSEILGKPVSRRRNRRG